MWKSIKKLLASKKAMMAFISAAVWLIAKAGFDIDTETLLGMVSPLWMYIFAQGVSDHGKGKAEAEAVVPANGNAEAVAEKSEAA